jgi:hypothetical protein
MEYGGKKVEMRAMEVMKKWVLVFVAGVVLAHASDPTAVYARVDKVVLEPNPESVATIQIWGVFSLAKPDDRNEYYLPPARGYLYFKLAGNKEAARKEWADLKDVAGTAQIVAFGSRFDPQPRLRKADERPENPDPYSTNIGLHKVRGRTDWPPVRALQDYKD